MKTIPKRVSLVLVMGLLVISCGGGGGNIKKVQNGVFADVDSTITVGQAFANDATLKGGEWKAYESEGREIVSYTVQFTPTQINAQRKANNTRPNLAVAKRIYDLGYNQSYRGFPLKGEELNQFKAVFEPVYKEATRTPQIGDFFNNLEDYPTYMDQWILERLDTFYFPYNERKLSRDEVIRQVWRFINTFNEDRLFAGNFNYAYEVAFKIPMSVNYEGVPEFETALKNSATNYKEQYRIAEEKLENAKKVQENQDIDAFITVSGGSIAFFFVMDKANKDAFNIGGIYFTEDLVLNCFDKRQIIWEYENSDPIFVLRYIYSADTRDNYFL